MRTTALALTIGCAMVCGSASVLADPLNPLDFPSLGKVTLASGAYTIDTTDTMPTLTGPGTNLLGTVSSTGVAVFRFDDLTVNAGATFTAAAGARGKATRPVAFLASGNLTFAGTLNASGANGGNGARNTGGIGGEGTFGGGRGTDAGVGEPGGTGGPVNDVEPNLRLSGGSGGGGGVTRNSGGGGGGGGAVEFGALGTLNLSGCTINARGGNGGAGGEVDWDIGRSGLGGGGSGGAVLLHGSKVTLGGSINVRGGDGGRGRGSSGGGGCIAFQALVSPDNAGTSLQGGFTDSNGRQRRGLIFAQPALTPANLDFGPVPVGSSITVNMKIRNTGGAGSIINGQFPVATAPFARIGTGIFSGLKQNAAATCAYTFAPAAVGPFSQSVTFLSNAGPVSVTLRGMGVSPAASSDSGSLRGAEGARGRSR